MGLCKSEGCTCFFDGSWIDCCNRHDKRYENARLSRYQADLLLYRCVRKKNRYVAPIMFIGVRLFGSKRYNKLNKAE